MTASMPRCNKDAAAAMPACPPPMQATSITGPTYPLLGGTQGLAGNSSQARSCLKRASKAARAVIGAEFGVSLDVRLHAVLDDASSTANALSGRLNMKCLLHFLLQSMMLLLLRQIVVGARIAFDEAMKGVPCRHFDVCNQGLHQAVDRFSDRPRGLPDPP